MANYKIASIQITFAGGEILNDDRVIKINGELRKIISIDRMVQIHTSIEPSTIPATFEDDIKVEKIKKVQTSGTHRDLIFIVGMPRSGSSLVEQILVSHKKVFGGGEIPYIQEIAQKIINEEKFDASLMDNYRNEYLALIAELNDSSSVFTDKELLNFKCIGLILSLFPNAKIINCTREPVDNLSLIHI